MDWIVRHIKSIMLVSGLLTCTMLYAAVAPRSALASTFGSTLEGPVAEIVVRNWGALIGLIGIMLIYGAFHPPARALVLSIAGISKLAFVALVLVYGREYLAAQAGPAVVIDSICVLIFAAYLIRTRLPTSPRHP
jgi:hypothetical protein